MQESFRLDSRVDCGGTRMSEIYDYTIDAFPRFVIDASSHSLVRCKMDTDTTALANARRDRMSVVVEKAWAVG
jgi:hypothetical protein